MFAFPRRLPRKGAKTRQQHLGNGKISSPPVQRSSKPAQKQSDAMTVATNKNPSLKDFPKAIRRLLKNDILVFRTASSVLHILPVAGLYTFLPKYLESQFRLAAHSANMISGKYCLETQIDSLAKPYVLKGIGGILVMGIGIFFSGVFIRVKKPSPKFVAAWIALTALLYAIGTFLTVEINVHFANAFVFQLGMALLMLFGCPMNDFAGLEETDR